MTNTRKFSEMTQAELEKGAQSAGLSSSGENIIMDVNLQFSESGTTAERPGSPAEPTIRYNTDLQKFEFWNGASWSQLEDSADIALLIARLAAHTAGDGASMIGLEDQGSVSNQTVQDLAEADFIVKSDTSALANAIALSGLSSGLLVNTTGTGVLTPRSIDGSANQIVITNGDGQAANPTASIATNPTLPGNANVVIPFGTTAERPGSPSNGYFRYNTTLDQLEYWDNNALAWVQVGADKEAGGANTQIQYNNNGVLDGDTGFTTDGAGSVNLVGDLSVDNLNFDSNTVSSNTLNSNININPGGTGHTFIGSQESIAASIGSSDFIDPSPRTTKIGFYDETHRSDVASLTPGFSKFGALIQGADSGNLAIGTRENTPDEGFSYVSGGGNFQSDKTYDTLVSLFLSTGQIRFPSGAVDIASDLRHDENTTNKITFTTDAQDFQTNDSSRLDVNNNGVRLGGLNARVTTIIDDDTMAAATNYNLSTSRAIKDYVDTGFVTIDGTQTITGNKTFSKPILASNGTNSAPSYSFSSDANTGIYSISSGVIGVSINGTKRYDFRSNGLWVTANVEQKTASDNGNTAAGVKMNLSGSTVTTVAIKGGNTTTSRFAPSVLFQRNHGPESSPTIIDNANYFGRLDFTGYDGDDYRLGATISAEADGTPSAGNMPGRIVWRTTTAGGITPSAKMTLTNNGVLHITNGISFDSEANILNHYKQNDTWTPVLVGSTVAGTPTGSFSGNFTRIGDTVTLSGEIALTSLGGLEGDVSIEGLPYSVRAEIGNKASVSIGFSANFAVTFVKSGKVLNGASTIDLYNAELNNTRVTHTDMNDTSSFIFSVTYRTSA